LKVNSLQHENNAYLLKLIWNFAFSNKSLSLLLKARVLKKFYDTILEHTSWTIDTCTVINLWNDKWCSSPYLSNIAGVSDGSRILMTTILQFWGGRDWIIP